MGIITVLTGLLSIQLFGMSAACATETVTGKIIKNYQSTENDGPSLVIEIEDKSLIPVDFNSLPTETFRVLKRIKYQEVSVTGEFQGEKLQAKEITLHNQKMDSRNIITGRIVPNDIDLSSEFVLKAENSIYAINPKDRLFKRVFQIYRNRIIRISGAAINPYNRSGHDSQADYEDDFFDDYDYDDEYEDDENLSSEIDYKFSIASVQFPSLYQEASGTMTRKWESNNYVFSIENASGEITKCKLTGELLSRFQNEFRDKKVKVFGPVFKMGGTSHIYPETVILIE